MIGLGTSSSAQALGNYSQHLGMTGLASDVPGFGSRGADCKLPAECHGTAAEVSGLVDVILASGVSLSR